MELKSLGYSTEKKKMVDLWNVTRERGKKNQYLYMKLHDGKRVRKVVETN